MTVGGRRHMLPPPGPSGRTPPRSRSDACLLRSPHVSMSPYEKRAGEGPSPGRRAAGRGLLRPGPAWLAREEIHLDLRSERKRSDSDRGAGRIRGLEEAGIDG